MSLSVSGLITESAGPGYSSSTITIGQIVFSNQSLANIAKVDGTLGGAWIQGGSADAYFYRYDAVTNSATAQFQHFDGAYTKQVEIRFNQVGADIAATQLNAKYASGQHLGMDFNDPTAGVSVNIATMAQAAGQEGYGLSTLTAVLASGPTLSYSSSFVHVAQTTVVIPEEHAQLQGSIDFVDVDLTDRPSVSYLVKEVIATAADQTTPLTLTPIQLEDIWVGFSASIAADSTNTGSVNWTYDVVQSKLNFLTANQTVNLKFVVLVNDGHGAVVPQDVQITINGTNDVASIGDPTVSSVKEDTSVDGLGNLTAVGSISISDTDQIYTSQSSLATVTVATGPGNLGVLVLSSTGSYTYTVANSATQYLGLGETKIDTFTVKSADGTTKDVTFTINGVNDAATFGGNSVGTIIESNTAQTKTGQLTITDVDSNESAFIAQSSKVGSYGNFNVTSAGLWTYSMSSAHDEFIAGKNYTDSLIVSSVDGTTKVVTVTMVGTNDSTVIGGVFNGTASEAGGVYNSQGGESTTGTLIAIDPDNLLATNQFKQVASTSTTNGYGIYSMSSSGVWSYKVNDNNVAVQKLNVGQVLSDSFVVSAIDGTTKSVSITIQGANDSAVIGGDISSNLIETDAAQSTSGHLSITDIDSTAQFNVQTNTVGLYGNLSIDSQGNWTYTMNGAHDEFKGGQVYTDSIAVSSSDGTQQIVSINILGTTEAVQSTLDVTPSIDPYLYIDEGAYSAIKVTGSAIDNNFNIINQGGLNSVELIGNAGNDVLTVLNTSGSVIQKAAISAGSGDDIISVEGVQN
ncbi:MAG: hypothetical protein EBQ60_03830, partial [Actinobacteria bacterium]|nr:hypothetical protein [Actinomycetota bacterium]